MRRLHTHLLVSVCFLFLVGGVSTADLNAQTFADATPSSGISLAPQPFAGAASYGRGAASYGRGAAWNDFDGDGDHDLFTAHGQNGDYIVWWNNAGVFTPQVILPDPGTPHIDHQAVSADFDNDGDADIYVSVGGPEPNLLFVNYGGGVFAEEAAIRGVAATGDSFSANFGDVDRDGWLDIYVATRTGPFASMGANTLYRNNGDGTFSDVTAAAGVTSIGLGLASLIVDIDGDLWPEIVVGNDKGAHFAPAAFYKNNRDGTFSDVSVAWNADAGISAMGITVGDMFNAGSGGWDVFMTDDPSANCVLKWKNNLGAFQPQADWDDEANYYGFDCFSSAWACFLQDLDNDADVDLLYTENPTSPRVFRNTGSGLFNDVTTITGMYGIAPPSNSACLVDYDDDGDLDLYLPGGAVPAALFENTTDSGNWIELDLKGTLSNRDGLGAVVICRTGQTTQRRVKLSGEGFFADGDRRVHFGLASHTFIDEIEIRWPSGTVQYLANVASNQKLTVVESSFQVTGTLAPGTSNPVTLSLPADAFIPYVCGLTTNVFTEYELGDGRSVLTDINDPLLALTSVAGNSSFVNASGFFDSAGTAAMTLNVPPVPQLSGFRCWMIGVSWNPLYVQNIKSIVGPQAIVIP